MESVWASLFLFLVLLAFLGISIWIAASIFLVAIVGLHFFTSVPATQVAGNILWNSTNSYTLVALPLFILMGEVLLKTKIAKWMFDGLAPWLSALPGGLLHVNVVASAFFAAVSGSSVATAATIGRINIPELLPRGYHPSLVVGSLAGAGTLGFLIPPSIVLIIYGVLAQVSIGQLFIAGIVPGLLLAFAFMIYLGGVGLVRRDLVPKERQVYTWRERFLGLAKLFPIAVLIFAVLGSIYTGLATPTESAAIGVLGAVLLGLFYRTLNWQNFVDAVTSTVRTTSMIGLIIASASVLSTTMGYLGIPRALAQTIVGLELSPYLLMFVLALFYILLGLFLDGISMIVVTLPITLPLVVAAGFEPLWFGIFLVLMVETAQITPPVGLNIFVIQSISNHSVGYVARAALPFFFIMLLITALVTAFPALATGLPSLMQR